MLGLLGADINGDILVVIVHLGEVVVVEKARVGHIHQSSISHHGVRPYTSSTIPDDVATGKQSPTPGVKAR